jgi:hypothetical protein
MASMTALSIVVSLMLAGVTIKLSGRPRQSLIRWILLLRPPLERPIV